MGLVALAAEVPATVTLLNVIGFYVALMVATAVHLLGPALVARLLGLRVRNITIGGSALLIGREIRGTRLELRLVPYLGATHWTAAPRARLALRVAVIQAAQPLSCVLVAGLIAVAAGYSWLDLASMHDQTGYVVGEFLVASLLAFAALDFVPLPGSTAARLASLAIKPRSHTEDLIAAHYIHDATPLETSAPRRALELIEQGIANAPNHAVLQYLRVSLLVTLKAYEAARIAYDDVTPRFAVPTPLRGLIDNQYAWACIQLGADYVGKADVASAAALAALPLRASVMHTRGAVLVELLRLDEARELLQRSLLARDDDKQAAHDHVWLAIAEARARNVELARAHLDKALAIDPEVECIDRARDAIAGLPT